MHYIRQFSGDGGAGPGRVKWSSHGAVDGTDVEVVIGDAEEAIGRVKGDCARVPGARA